MDYANADGSVAEMCGNGIRCVGVLAHERGLVDDLTFDVATRAGVKHLELRTDDRGAVRSVTVGMGARELHAGVDPDARPRVGDVPRSAVRDRRRT